jgi:hypothetical protein
VDSWRSGANPRACLLSHHGPPGSFQKVTPSLIFGAECLLFVVLVNSVFRFAITGFRRAGTPHTPGNKGTDADDDRVTAGARLLASLSSAVSLAVVVAIYVDSFRRATMNAARSWTSDQSFLNGVQSAVVGGDQAVRSGVNFMNPGPDVSYRPHPSIWPIVIVVSSYAVRWLIYVTVERGNYRNAAITGSAYWSHMTAYAMIVSFLVVVAGWNALLVVPVSMLLVLGLLIGVAGIFEDIFLLVRVGGRLVMTYAKGVGAVLARHTVAVARLVRVMFQRGHELYVERVRMPVQRFTGRLEMAADQFDQRAHDELADEDERNRRLFSRAKPVPAEQPSSPEAPPVIQ